MDALELIWRRDYGRRAPVVLFADTSDVILDQMPGVPTCLVPYALAELRFRNRHLLT